MGMNKTFKIDAEFAAQAVKYGVTMKRNGSPFAIVEGATVSNGGEIKLETTGEKGRFYKNDDTTTEPTTSVFYTYYGMSGEINYIDFSITPDGLKAQETINQFKDDQKPAFLTMLLKPYQAPFQYKLIDDDLPLFNDNNISLYRNNSLQNIKVGTFLYNGHTLRFEINNDLNDSDLFFDRVYFEWDSVLDSGSDSLDMVVDESGLIAEGKQLIKGVVDGTYPRLIITFLDLSYNHIFTENFSDAINSIDGIVSVDDNVVDVITGYELPFNSTVKITLPSESDVMFYPVKNGVETTSSVYLKYYDSVGDEQFSYFTLSPDGLTVTLQLTIEPDLSYGTPEFYVAVMPKLGVSGSNNVYLMTDDELQVLTNDRIQQWVNGETLEINEVDFGMFLLSTLRLPFKLDDGFIRELISVRLGTLDSLAKGKEVITDLIPLDLGEIVTPLEFNNSLDFENTVAVLRLPFASPISLDLNYVIGETISVRYDVDCYSGIATVNVSSTKTNDVVYTVQVDLGVQVPTAEVNRLNAFKWNDDIQLIGDNGIRKPYIEIIRNDAIFKDGFFSIPINDENILMNETGFIVVDEINLKSSALNDEREMILNMVKSGVIIK